MGKQSAIDAQQEQIRRQDIAALASVCMPDKATRQMRERVAEAKQQYKNLLEVFPGDPNSAERVSLIEAYGRMLAAALMPSNTDSPLDNG